MQCIKILWRCGFGDIGLSHICRDAPLGRALTFLRNALSRPANRNAADHQGGLSHTDGHPLASFTAVADAGVER